MIIFSRKELEDVLHKYDTWAGVVRELGIYDKHNKMVPLLRCRLDELNIDYSFMGKIPIRNKLGHYRNQFTKFTDDEVFKRDNGLSIRVVRRAFSEFKDKRNFR